MLNELQNLSKALNMVNIVPPTEHPWIKGVKKGDALVVNVNDVGGVESLEYCSSDRVDNFWNIDESKKATFPKMNFDSFWGEFEDEDFLKKIVKVAKKKKWREWEPLIEELMSKCPESCWKMKQKKDKWNRLYKFSHEIVLPKLTKDSEKIRKLIECFNNFEPSEGTNGLNDFVKKRIDKLVMDIAQRLMFDLKNGHLDCFDFANKLFIGKQCNIIFNHDKNDILVANMAVKKELIGLFSNRKTLQKDNEKKYICALTGEKTTVLVRKFPEPNLPQIGPSYLMSMAKEALCHYRYGKVGSDIFSLSDEKANQLNSVSRYIVSPDKKDKTWIPVLSGKWEGNPKKEQKDLLISYVEKLPALQNENLALLMGGDSEFAEQRFEVASQIVCDAIRKQVVNTTEASIKIFVIRKISKGQSQVVLNEFCSIADVQEAVRVWQEAANNHPYFSLYLLNEKKEKSVKEEPQIPYPVDLLKLLQYQWTCDGLSKNKINACSLRDAYDLFFDRGKRTETSARRSLQLMLQRVTPLCIGGGRAKDSKDFDIWNHYDFVAKRSLLLSVSFIGILLFKLGIKKEEYMKTEGYNIGRLLSLCDCLHKEYCRYVRSKDKKNPDIPNQLLGNAALRTVLINPEKGLAILSERIPIYIAWADKEEFKEVLLVKKNIGIVSELLSDQNIPKSVDDILKAQILLGYLAHSE